MAGYGAATLGTWLTLRTGKTPRVFMHVLRDSLCWGAVMQNEKSAQTLPIRSAQNMTGHHKLTRIRRVSICKCSGKRTWKVNGPD